MTIRQTKSCLTPNIPTAVSLLRSSSVGTYQRMFSFMESQRPSVFSSSNDEGVERVIKGAGKYAFLMESSSIEYITERHCKLTQVGGLLDSKSYGIALPPGPAYATKTINELMN